MARVGGAIGDVIEEIHRARQRAEDDERRQGAQRRVAIEQTAAEDQAGKQQEVLRPLLGAQRDEERKRQTFAEDEKLRTASASLS